ncbi:Acetylornithine deacetylase/Succinyl-diaminopimelate desuccinylase [Lentzea albidocapillata subsp. violacea]|uniref:Acetylornithine deacetylase/Succinyl-diaminopimelate desuccinylase n=1 Tax=Lentzea albidocapillata subsp. violacea TaxID=128104 RepID=A0A1G9QA27_9PSEU|nr:Acetylornithine deacetylase/Succinyl-diaminopimelate desuccinylase [Lentzea albidocapillata subsp. violacea]
MAGLCEWIKIPSIGVDPTHHPDVRRSAEWLANALREDGWPEVEVWGDGPALPAVFACWPADDPDAPTVLVYGHHDVQPVDPPERWDHPPFEPVISGDEIRGRGASDDKGQVAMHLLAVKAHLAATGQNAPSVTLKLFVEGEEESGSPHLRKLLEDHEAELGCDLVVFTDTALHERDAPTVTTGQRGVLGAEITFEGGTDDVHSGRAGGAIPNPATALAKLIAALHDDDNRIRLEGFYDDVREPSTKEREDYAALPFDEQKWLQGNGGGAQATHGETGYSTLERIWVRPTAEVNGISGGYTGPGLKTIVPATATAKISFRLVPDQHPEKVAQQLSRFVAEHTPPGITARVGFRGEGVPPYAISPYDPANAAVKEAMELAFGRPVRFARAGGSGPAAVLQQRLGVPLVYLGATLPDDRVHAPNERVVVPVLLQGAEAAAHLWRMLAQAEIAKRLSR